MRVRFTSEAAADLESILEYLGGVAPAAASRFVDRVEDLRAKLRDNPEIGHATSESGIRQLNARPVPYIVLYEIIDQTIIIHAIRHGARNPSTIAIRDRK